MFCLAGSFEGLLHVNKIDHNNTHSQQSSDLLGARFPYNPLHLLCMQQLHTFSKKYELESKQCVINVWCCTGILPGQIKFSKKHFTTACTHAHLLYNRNCIGTLTTLIVVQLPPKYLAQKPNDPNLISIF